MQYDATSYSGEGDCNVLHSQYLNLSGGFELQSGLIMADGKGPMYEYIAPYTEVVGNYPLDRTISDSSIVMVKQIDYYDPYTDMDEIKQKLMEGHIGFFGYTAGGAEVSSYKPATESVSADHAVALIGWDDNYSKSNFPNGTPEGDGAWIIKNSWGTEIGDDGFVYVSYYNENQYVGFLSEVVVNDGSNYLYSYDHGYSTGHDLTYRGNATMANVFTAERDETLTGTSFSVYDKTGLDQSYSVSVYKLSSNSTYATQGVLMTTVKNAGTVDHNGTYHVEFSEPVSLKAGERFSICVEFTGDSVYIPIDTTEDYYMVYTCYTVASAGQSYVCYDGKWTDISADGKSNVRIKAYTSTDVSYDASLNGKLYAKLSDAIEAAGDGDTVRLLQNVTSSQLTIGKDVNILMCGYDLTIEMDDASEAGITVKDADVKFSYGRIVQDIGTVFSSTNGSLALDRIYLVNDGISVPMVSNGTAVTVKSVTYEGTDLLKAKGGSASLVDSYITCTGRVIEADGCTASVEGGIYSTGSEPFTGSVKVISGEFYPFDPSAFKDADSYLAVIKSKGTVIGYAVYRNEVSSDSGANDMADAIFNGGNVKLLRDVTATDTYVLNDDVTIDLNGFDWTLPSSSVAFESVFFNGTCNVTIINTSETPATFTCNYLATHDDEGCLTISDNVNVIMRNYITPNVDKEPNVIISDKATVRRVSSSLTSEETIDYTTTSEGIKSVITLTQKDNYGNVTGSYKGTIVISTLLLSALTYKVTDGTAYDTSGKETGKWTRDYDMSYYLRPDKVTVNSTTVTDTVTDSSDIVKVNYSRTVCFNTYQTFVTSAKAEENGQSSINTQIYGRSHTEDVNADLLKMSLDEVKAAEAKIEGLGCSTCTKALCISSEHSSNKLLVKDVINEYLSGGYDISVSTAKYGYTLKAGTGLLTGDTLIEVNRASASDINDKQQHAITTGVAYTVTATVDGVRTTELPCSCTVSFGNSAFENAKFYSVDEEGNLAQLDAKYYASSRTYEIALDGNSTFVMNPVEYDNSVTENTVIWVTVIVGAVAVLGACAVLIGRRH